MGVRTLSLFSLSLALAAPLLARADEPSRATVLIADAALSPLSLDGREPSVVASLPLSPRGAPRIVVLLHGWDSCAPGMVGADVVRCGGQLTDGYGLAAETERSGTDTLLLVPQLAMLAHDASPGRFEQPGFRRRWLDATLDAVAAQRGEASVSRFRNAPIVLAAHSAGYLTLLALLHDPSLRTRTDMIALFDALYGGAETLARWAAEDAHRRVVSIHTASPTTTRESATLIAAARARQLTVTEDATDLSSAMRAARIVSFRTSAPHRRAPQRHFAELLSALGR